MQSQDSLNAGWKQRLIITGTGNGRILNVRKQKEERNLLYSPVSSVPWSKDLRSKCAAQDRKRHVSSKCRTGVVAGRVVMKAVAAEPNAPAEVNKIGTVKTNI